jgi:hypothetical protein
MGSIAALATTSFAPLPEGEAGSREAVRRFEALLLERLLAPLTESPKSLPAWVDGGSAGRMARELHVAELARIAAERGSLGVEKWLDAPGGSES